MFTCAQLAGVDFLSACLRILVLSSQLRAPHAGVVAVAATAAAKERWKRPRLRRVLGTLPWGWQADWVVCIRWGGVPGKTVARRGGGSSLFGSSSIGIGGGIGSIGGIGGDI